VNTDLGNEDVPIGIESMQSIISSELPGREIQKSIRDLSRHTTRILESNTVQLIEYAKSAIDVNPRQDFDIEQTLKVAEYARKNEDEIQARYRAIVDGKPLVFVTSPDQKVLDDCALILAN